ncbi:hypothetical protein B0H17DRAFT_1133921 [Mycena rosella]|uniref:Uncharacterized protein n=1 Tax=Mycena rosella TaxID=1033263 RepID=A0AAD7DHR2_MYCRO|nr:hypothetical protein B0H17DRAFT_1133921 [Mycena rosella]
MIRAAQENESEETYAQYSRDRDGCEDIRRTARCVHGLRWGLSRLINRLISRSGNIATFAELTALEGLRSAGGWAGAANTVQRRAVETWMTEIRRMLENLNEEERIGLHPGAGREDGWPKRVGEQRCFQDESDVASAIERIEGDVSVHFGPWKRSTISDRESAMASILSTQA